MNKSILSITLAAVLLLSACGDESAVQEPPAETTKEENTTDPVIEKEVVEEEPAEEAVEPSGDNPTGDWEEAEFGQIKLIGVGYSDQFGIDGTDAPLTAVDMGPMKLGTTAVMVVDIKPNEDAKEMFFEGKDEVRAVIIDLATENTAEQDVSFYVDQSILVTNTGEQVDPDMWMTDDVGGDFFGQVKKEGSVWWLLQDTEQVVNEVTMIVAPPSDLETWDNLAEEQRFTFEVLSFDEAQKKDKE